MSGVPAQDRTQVPRGPATSIRSAASARTVRPQRSEKSFALDLRGGIFTTSIS